MNDSVIYIILCIHFLCCLVSFILSKLRNIGTRLALLPIVFMIPVFGIICFYIGGMANHSQRGTKQHSSELSIYSSSGYSKIDIDEVDKPGAVVPLEEAILINDIQTRRKVMIDILHREPTQYLDLLKVARLNEDVEVTHYATTTIIEIQRDFESEIQHKSSLVKNNPSNIDMLDDYIDTLNRYINSGLLEGHLLIKQRMLILQILLKRIELDPYYKETYYKIIENDSALHRYDVAEQAFQTLIENWPEDENAWLAGIRIYMESNNKQQKVNILDKIKMMPIKWSSKGKERLKFLYGEETLKMLADTSVNSGII
jgi:tetratricopeptide (TPR) repeat protein